MPAREIGNNSLIRDIREAPGSGIVELFAGNLSSASVESVIDASNRPRDSGSEVKSNVTSNLEEAIYASYMRKPLDLNRSLPPTPISESPQMSPTVATPASLL
ncbi:MAG: hypothetical protein Q9191_006901 [Dirinaria sp. TL-2023a]